MTAFFAIVVKACLMLFFVRLIFNVFFNILFFLQPILTFVALGSMFVGALGALKQVRIKRFIAYTSINQVGFMLLGIASCNLIGVVATLLYIVLYVIMSFIFFSLLLNSEHVITKKTMIYLSDLYSLILYHGESTKHFVLVMLSMAGLPPLGGFLSKLFIYFATIEARLDITLICALLLSILSTYYYLSFVRYI